LEIIDERGTVLGIFGADEKGAALFLCAPDQRPVFGAYGRKDGASLYLYGAGKIGDDSVIVAAYPASKGGGVLNVYGRRGKAGGTASLLGGTVWASSAPDKCAALLFANENGGQLTCNNNAGNAVVSIGAQQSGGGLEIEGPEAGNIIMRIEPSGNPMHQIQNSKGRVLMDLRSGVRGGSLAINDKDGNALL
jgi:hypothetical protein